jgi:hypothetical protein
MTEEDYDIEIVKDTDDWYRWAIYDINGQMMKDGIELDQEQALTMAQKAMRQAIREEEGPIVVYSTRRKITTSEPVEAEIVEDKPQSKVKKHRTFRLFPEFMRSK